jgi:hypothetical protein
MKYLSWDLAFWALIFGLGLWATVYSTKFRALWCLGARERLQLSVRRLFACGLVHWQDCGGEHGNNEFINPDGVTSENWTILVPGDAIAIIVDRNFFDCKSISKSES